MNSLDLIQIKFLIRLLANNDSIYFKYNEI
jgi:hypothetical protein